VSTQRRNVLASNAVFRRLWCARAVSFVGDGVALTALVLHVQATRGTGTAVGALLLAQALPHLLGPLTGTVADRVDQRALMIWCDLGRCLIFGVAAWLLPSMAWLLVVMAAASTLDTFFAPAGRSAVPALVEDADLVSANAWLGTALNLQVALGPLIGGALVASIGVRGALAVDAGSFLLSAILLLGVPKLPPSIGREHRERFSHELREGLSFARSHPVARAVVVTLFLGVAFAGIDNVALVFLARTTLDAGPAGFGVIASAFGIGMLVASVLLSRRATMVSPRMLFIGGWAMTGLGTLLTAVSPAVVFAVGAQAVSGAGNGADNVASDTLIQRSVPRAMLGRVFGLSSTAAFVGGGLAYAAGGPILDATSARTVFLIGAAGTFAVVLLATKLLPRTPPN
jgi:MFS family permease